MKRFIGLFGIILIIIISGCTNRESDTVSYNISYKADNFEVVRRIVMFNGITDKILLEIVGRCSIEVDSTDKQLEVTCKTGKDSYKKHFLGLSDNVSYFVEQVGDANVDSYQYYVNIRPQTLLPAIEIKVKRDELKDVVPKIKEK